MKTNRLAHKGASLLLLTLILGSHLVVPTANAGLLDWLTGDARAETPRAERSSDADQMYLSGFGSADAVTTPEPVSALSGNAVVAMTPTNVRYIPYAGPRTLTVQVSAYNSEAAQTDSSPFIMANGNHVHWGAVAANIYDANGRNIPFGTRIKIPAVYGDQIFVVEDRLNKRYRNNVDIWMEHKSDALKFGRRTLRIEIIP